MMHGTHNLIQRMILGFILVFNFLGESVTSETVPDLSPRIVYACEGNEVKIECAKGLRIQIIRSNYGRLNMAVCNEGQSTQIWDLKCTSNMSLGIVSSMCDNKTECSVLASNTVIGDPCFSVNKYLAIEYNCRKGDTSFPVTNPPKTQRWTKTQSPSLPSSMSPLGSTPSDGSAVTPSSTASIYSYPDANRDFASGDVCEAKFHRNINWPRAWPGQTVVIDCPNNQAVRKAIWKCGVVPVKWIDQPDLSQCISPAVLALLDLMSENQQRFSYGAGELIASELVALTDVGEQVFGGDLLTVTTAMQKFVLIDHHLQENNEEKTIQLVHKVNQAILDTSSNLLNESRIESWYDIPQILWPTIATTLLSTIEKCAYQVASVTAKPMNLINIKSNLVVEVRVINTTETVEDQMFPSDDSIFPAGSWASGGSSISLTGKTVRQFEVAGLSKMVFATYNNIDKWLRGSDIQNDTSFVNIFNSSHDENSENSAWNASKSTEDKAVNTRIITASFVSGNGQHVKLAEPVVFMLKHIVVEEVSNATCSFWDYSTESMKGQWSTRGCHSLESNASHTQCSCEHLTNFAVLMSVNGQKLTEIQKFSLSLITYFGCVLSIICLAMAFLTFQFFKNLQCDRNTIHKNLVVNLGIAEVIFLIGIIQYETPVLCAFVAGILHYLFLVTFFWMCIEGIQLYVMLVEVFESGSSPVKWYYLSAYGIPAVIVGISSIVSRGEYGYGTDTHCWLSTEKGFIWAFVGPVCVIFCINAVMLGVAIYVMCRHASNAVNVWKARQKTTFENVRSWIKGAVVLVVLLGLTWAFGLLYINEQSVVMAYVFTAFNSTQGVFIFLFHCLMNEKVQKEYKRWVRHRKWLPEELRVRCGGVRSSVSASPIHSSSSGVNKIIQEQKLSFEYFSRLFSKNADRKRSSTTTLPSCSNNNIKRGYNINLRSSLGQDSVFHENESSRVYSDQTDPYSYMESGHMALGPEHEFYLATGDISMMEGSVADTDYLEDYTKRASSVIDVDKYKIRTQATGNGRLPETLPNMLSTGQDLKNGIAKRSINEQRAAIGESDQPKQLMSYTNLGASGYGLDSSSSRQNP